MAPLVAAVVHAVALVSHPLPSEMRALPDKKTALDMHYYWSRQVRYLSVWKRTRDIQFAEANFQKLAWAHVINVQEDGSFPGVQGPTRVSIGWLRHFLGPPELWNFTGLMH